MLRREERARAEVPPSGLFGALGLQPFEEARKRPRGPVDPFERVVSVLEGTRAFADIVSWNIEHLHAPANWDRIPKVAELMRSFRCDFWGLQEVDARSLAQLVETMNSSGRTRYTFVATKEAGQQCGAVFRTDTTTVEVLDVPEDLFDDEIDVELADSSGGVAKREVFYRQPFLCQVHVQQAEGAVFDFRCAVVHLKSTDTTLKDTGNSLREAAAKALATWLEADGEGDGERDYLILGDMNAETAEQGLRSFSESEGLELLSVGMQDKYGNAEALTRVASQRLLDHIVVTDEASASIPGEDKAEQIIIRSDTRIAEWTSAFSDHVPVAVRFVFGEDVD